MNAPELRALQQLARLEGVRPSYLDTAGQRQEALPETLMAVLKALGVALDRPSQAVLALREVQQARSQRPLDDIVVAWDGRPRRLPVNIAAAHSNRKSQLSLTLEQGQRTVLRIDGRSAGRAEVRLPKTPPGYHMLQLDAAHARWDTLLISAPSKTYSEPGPARRWGIFLPMYAARTERSWGAGNIADWQRLSRWTASLGGEVMATLPLLAAFLDTRSCEPSPYSPASRLFWNEFYIDLTAVPELSACPKAGKLLESARWHGRLEALRQRGEIDYTEEFALRREVLELLCRRLHSGHTARKQQFQYFLRDYPEVEDYARFRATNEKAQRPWASWPERQRGGILRSGDYSEKNKWYHAYVQWLADEQINRLSSQCEAHAIRIYLDLPLGVHPDSYDVWRRREFFAAGTSVGAPPDAFFSKGQNWGFPPLHPKRIREQRYAYVLEYLRFQMRHARLLRIDHVMGLHRLYWVPHGHSPAAGAYVGYAADELYAILSLESHRHRTTLVGENLGTVPPEVNWSMKRHGVRRMYVLQFEQTADRHQPVRRPPRASVVSLNTHDLPTFAAHWRGIDIKDHAELGLVARTNVAGQELARRKLNQVLLTFLRRGGWFKAQRDEAEAALHACLKWLAASPAEVLLVNLEDLWLEEQPQNVPGTSCERPNWRRKARLTVEQIEGNSQIRELLQELNRLRRLSSGRWTRQNRPPGAPRKRNSRARQKTRRFSIITSNGS